MSDHSLWETTAAQQAWIDMWRYTAARYRDDPIVVGYYLMVEPHASEAVAGLEAEEFYARYEGTLVDWNQLYPRIVEAVREEDERTPVIVDAEGWSGLAWLSYHPPAPDERIVYSFHQYLPLHYTIGPLTDHPYGDLVVVYRGEADLDGDGDSEMFDERWMDSLLAPADRFMAERDARLTVNELGVVRWVPEGHAFMRDQLELLEARGMNHAIWLWNASFEMWEGQTDAFGLQFGPDLVPGRDRASEELLDAVSDIWMRNTERPWLDSPERTAN